jgi:hypothetical protein
MFFGGNIMEIGQLYNFVLVLVLVGLIIGVGILVLDKFAGTAGVTGDASQALNDTRDAIADISSDWLPLIVVVGVLALILFLVIRSFGGVGRR